MPELPEVETVRLQLQKYLINHSIEDVEIKASKLFEGDKNQLIGTRILGIRRFAKVLSIDLDNGSSIVIHIKMTGQLIYRNKNQVMSDESGTNNNLSKKVVGGLGGKHTHVIFYLDRGSKLFYNDVRKFGWIRVVKRQEVKGESFISKLGPEPNVGQSKTGLPFLTLSEFQKILSKTTRAIKIVLMDQSKIAGVGNIYANDALWLAGINPKKESKKLVNEEIKKLFDAIHKVLKSGLKYGGASELAFVAPDGAEGEYQDHTLSYGHEGDLCKRPACRQAGAKIEKYFLSGRGTYVCPACQS